MALGADKRRVGTEELGERPSDTSDTTVVWCAGMGEAPSLTLLPLVVARVALVRLAGGVASAAATGSEGGGQVAAWLAERALCTAAMDTKVNEVTGAGDTRSDAGLLDRTAESAGLGSVLILGLCGGCCWGVGPGGWVAHDEDGLTGVVGAVDGSSVGLDAGLVCVCCSEWGPGPAWLEARDLEVRSSAEARWIINNSSNNTMQHAMVTHEKV